jgi:Mn-dependent DtxR family transcriptional regulator
MTLTEGGLQRARAVARDQRLWEQFLLHAPELAGTMADLSQETVEVLPPDLIAELEQGLRDTGRLPESGPRGLAP